MEGVKSTKLKEQVHLEKEEIMADIQLTRDLANPA